MMLPLSLYHLQQTSMVQVQQPIRYRGFVLTPTGLQKLQSGIQRLETHTKVRQSARTIAERVQLIEADGIHPITVRKLLRCQQGVDKRSIDHVFAALQLVLETGDYAHTSLSGTETIPNAAPDSQSDSELDPIVDAGFCGRIEETAQLKQNLSRCRLIAVLGVEGIGKTALVKQVMADQDEFDCCVWKSLHPATPIAETLMSLLQSLWGRSTQKSTTVELISLLLKKLKQQRCLLVLDGVEAILENRPLAGYYRSGYEAYGELFRAIAEHPHASCVILTSQEKPRDFKRLEGRFVQSMQIEGLTRSESQQLLQTQKVFSRSQAMCDVGDFYGGNPLLLKWIAARVCHYFDGNLSDYLGDQLYEPLLFQDLQDLLHQQFDRLSDLEQKVIVQLAVRDDWVSLSSLLNSQSISQQHLLDVLDSLHRRSLLQKRSVYFKLLPTMAAFIRSYKIDAKTRLLRHYEHSAPALA